MAAAPRNALARRELASTLTNENNQNFPPTPAMWQEAIESWRVLIAINRTIATRTMILFALTGKSIAGAKPSASFVKCCASGRRPKT